MKIFVAHDCALLCFHLDNVLLQNKYPGWCHVKICPASVCQGHMIISQRNLNCFRQSVNLLMLTCLLENG